MVREGAKTRLCPCCVQHIEALQKVRQSPGRSGAAWRAAAAASTDGGAHFASRDARLQPGSPQARADHCAGPHHGVCAAEKSPRRSCQAQTALPSQSAACRASCTRGTCSWWRKQGVAGGWAWADCIAELLSCRVHVQAARQRDRHVHLSKSHTGQAATHSLRMVSLPRRPKQPRSAQFSVTEDFANYPRQQVPA